MPAETTGATSIPGRILSLKCQDPNLFNSHMAPAGLDRCLEMRILTPSELTETCVNASVRMWSRQFSAWNSCYVDRSHNSSCLVRAYENETW